MDLAVLIAVALAASFAQGFLGFGFGILAMSVLAGTHDLLHAAGVVNLTALLSAAVFGWMLRRHVDWRLAGALLPSAVLGVVAGVLALGAWHGAEMTRALGAAVVATALFQLLGRPPARALSRAWGVPVGAAAGALTGAFNIGGPPIVAYLYSQPSTPHRMKGTTQVIFMTMSLLRVGTALGQGLFDTSILRDAALSLPPLLIGLFAGHALANRIPPERFRRVSWSFFGLLGAMLALRA